MHATVLLSVALSALPASKLGAYVVEALGPGAGEILAACPRVVLYQLPSATAVNSLDALHASCPETQIAVRVHTPGLAYDTTKDAATSADGYWNLINGSLAGTSPLVVRWIEGPWEVEALPDWTADETAAAWVATFYSKLADRISAAGYEPLVGSIPAGKPKLAGELGAGSPNLFKPIADAMKAKTYAWAWSYHAFSTDLSQDATKAAADSLRYRRIRDECDLRAVPLILSAAGQEPAWKLGATSAQAYLDWLFWLDDRLREDGTVVGSALYQFGGTTGVPLGYSLQDLAADLASHLKSPGSDAGDGDGGPGDAAAPRDAAKSGGTNTSHGVSVEDSGGCATAGVQAAPAVALLLGLALWIRRR